MVRKPKTDTAQAPKKLLVAGSDPILSPDSGAKTPFGVPGRSRPGIHRNSIFRSLCRVGFRADVAKNSWQLLPSFSGKSCQNSRARFARDSFCP
jgi:hypothetical protein